MTEIIGKAKHSKKSNFHWKPKTGNKIKTGEDEIQQLLFLIYVNNFPSAFNLLNIIVFANNTNLF